MELPPWLRAAARCPALRFSASRWCRGDRFADRARSAPVPVQPTAEAYPASAKTTKGAACHLSQYIGPSAVNHPTYTQGSRDGC
jgi:hypothetical protein